ncbi:MAG: hypothetical protein KDB14_21200 [Planctomycetales bacterium]|nr:hypothetical protein [Planctomycetales bacterium]
MSSIQFISQTKLSELRRQRDLLRAEYQALLPSADNNEPVTAQSLAALHEGLKEVRVANRRMHQQLPNLDLLFKGASPSPALLGFWRQQLLNELEQGSLRAELVFLFGLLLGEWDEGDSADRMATERRSEAHQRLLELAQTPAPARERALLASCLDRIVGGRRDEVVQACQQELEKIRRDELARMFGLRKISQCTHHPPGVRAEAKQFLQDEVLAEELQQAVRAATRDARCWTWTGMAASPEGAQQTSNALAQGVGTRALWTRNKWRLYPSLTLIELALAESCSESWTTVENSFSDTAQKLNREARLAKLEDLGAPEVIIVNERRMLAMHAARIDFPWYEQVDPWDGKPPLRDDVKAGGIVAKRAHEQVELRYSGAQGYYANGVNRLVRLVNAEVQTLRAAFPDKPVVVAKLDIKDFFPSVPHDTLLTLARGLGMPPTGVAFVQRFLELPLQTPDGVRVARRGVPMEQPLSHWLCEYLLRALECHLQETATVRVLRELDDICLLGASVDEVQQAWNAVQVFLEDCGLELNLEKCGGVIVGAEAADRRAESQDTPFTDRDARWDMLELQSSGAWRTHEPTFASYLEGARAQVESRRSVLGMVATYNDHLQHLVSSLGLAMDLGDEHRRSVNDCLRRFDLEFFAPNIGIASGLQQRIRERHLGETKIGDLPEGWLAWPITAGGLGLRSVTIISGQYQRAFEHRVEVRKQPPEDCPPEWQYTHQQWQEFYQDQLTCLEPKDIAETPQMKSMVSSFIARGNQISGGKQKNSLSAYWRAVLALYGPEILQKLGTFEFLLTELVPLQLIHENLQTDLELG